MPSAEIGGLVRTLLAFGAGWLVNAGILDSAVANELAAAGTVIVVAIWSVIQKRKSS